MNTESEIRTIMTLDPYAVKASTLISRVIELFESEKIHHMPVVDEQRHVVGIISSSDLQQIDKRRLAEDSQEAAPVVRDYMVHNPVCLELTDTLGLAADMFLTRAFHAAPVVEDDKLVGIITTHDLIREAYGTTFSRKGAE